MESGKGQENNQTSPQEKDEGRSSVYELLKGRLTFTNESPWLRLILFIIMAAFFLGLCLLLKGVALGVVGAQLVGDRWKTVFRWFGRR